MPDDLFTSLVTTDLTRRMFVVTTVAAGFALAVQPVSALTISTDAAGLTAGAVKISTAGGEMPAYRAMPATGGRFPALLVVHEVFGVHEYIQDVCRRLARLSYLAVAPLLYARQGDVTRLPDIQTIILQVVSKVPDAQVMSDLDAAVTWAEKSGKGDLARLGITGFCWGGRIVWLYAAHNPTLKAGVAWYGPLTRPATALQPKQPIDVAASLKAPVLGLYAGNDPGIPLESVEEMRRRLAAAGSPSEIVVYPDAPHGFHADYRPSYRKAAAGDGWTRLRAWFRTHGVA